MAEQAAPATRPAAAPRRLRKRVGPGRIAFQAGNYTLMGLYAAVCFIPLLHVLAVSFSTGAAAVANLVGLWPVGFNTKAYEFVATRVEFLRSVGVSFLRLGAALPLYMAFNCITAYALSKRPKLFPWRSAYLWFLFVTMLFNGGLIPTYFVVLKMGLINRFWSLLIPLLPTQVFNVILLLNFFRRVPVELEEAAFIDGAGHLQILWRVFLPVSTAATATISLFVLVFHWNEWFFGMIYLNDPRKFPLATYLRTILIDLTSVDLDYADQEFFKFISDENSKAAQIFIGMAPILLVYPFLQRYFTKGLVLGAVKG